MKRKQPTKVKKIPETKSPASAIISSETFHKTFPLTLEFMEGADSYIARYKLKKSSYKLFDTKPKNED